MEPIEELKNEHQGVETMLRIIEAVSKRYAGGHEVDNRDFDAILEFLSGFVDRCHHGKEEDFRCPAFIDLSQCGGKDFMGEFDPFLLDGYVNTAIWV